MKILDEQQVKEWTDTRPDERSPFYGFESITEEAAKMLVAQKRTPIELPSIKELLPSIAEILATFKGERIDIQSLEVISAESAKFLGQGQYKELWLHGVTSLSGSAVEELANYRGMLCLDGLQSLPKSNISGLLGFRGDGLSLRGLEKLPSWDTRLLPSFSGWLDLSGLVDLSPGAAKDFSEHGGDLSFDGLKELSDSTAKELSHFGQNCSQDDDYPTLSLQSLSSLSDVAISHLSKVRANLSLHGIEALSENGARDLANHQGALEMELIEAGCHDEPTLGGDLGYCPIPQKGIDFLSKHNGPINGFEPKQWALENSLYVELYESREKVRAGVVKNDNEVDKGLLKMIDGADRDIAKTLFEDFSEKKWAAIIKKFQKIYQQIEGS